GTADRNRSHWSTSKTPSYTKSVSWQHHPVFNSGFHVLSCTVFVKKNFLCKEFCIIAARNSWRQI
ncbi:hypothetical protein SNC77_01030, partial [Escherichia coli]|nr:hypothetical protein [Escherichia coli]